ncbi:MAG: hypothetical protein HYS44_02270 [Candidatus Niyogibacteria bacterium]|nr:hypothetical protein [Candidatus Niyogibacteria bacterium]
MLMSSDMIGFLSIAYAAEGAVPIPEIFQQPDLVTFLPWLFSAMLAAATILSVFVITLAGFQWMTGAISESQVSDAKNRIRAALIGLALAFSSYLILNTINPDLVNFRLPQAPAPVQSALYYCGTAPSGATSQENCDATCEVNGTPQKCTKQGDKTCYRGENGTYYSDFSSCEKAGQTLCIATSVSQSTPCSEPTSSVPITL